MAGLVTLASDDELLAQPADEIGEVVEGMMLLAGCDGHSRRASARLRTENAAMQQQIETLQARQTELEATLATVESEHEVNAEALGQMPQVAGLMVSPLHIGDHLSELRGLAPLFHL